MKIKSDKGSESLKQNPTFASLNSILPFAFYPFLFQNVASNSSVLSNASIEGSFSSLAHQV